MPLILLNIITSTVEDKSDGVRQIIQGEKTMNSIPENPTTGAADLKNGATSPESMTATFAFG